MFEDQRRYAVLPANLIKLYGEIGGYYDLNDQACHVLAEDATYRLNEVLNQSENLKRRCNKERLDVNEINLVLKCYNVKPIEGYESMEKNKIRSTLFDEKEKPIDLAGESDALLRQKQFLRVRSVKLSSDYVQLKYTNRRQPIQQADLPDELKSYYNFLVANLFTPNTKLFERLLNDLSSSDQLGDLADYLVDHLSRHLHAISSSKNPNDLLRLILVVESLIKNKQLDLKLQNSFVQLVDLALDCLLNEFGPLKDGASNGAGSELLFKFRYCSAKLLRSVIHKFHYAVDRSLAKLLDLLLSEFINSPHPDVKYGIMIFFRHLNPFIFFELLFPSLIQLVQQLELKRTNQTIQSDERQLFNLTLTSLVSCFNYVVNSGKLRDSDEFDVAHYYSAIRGVYGDSFTKLASTNDSNFAKIIRNES